MPALTYFLPTIEDRRDSWAARVAYYAWVLTAYVIPRARKYMCHCCGEPGPGDWCNMCEVRGNHPIRGQPSMITPICRACIALDLTCPICDTKPSEGPSDAQLAPFGPISASGAFY